MNKIINDIERHWPWWAAVLAIQVAFAVQVVTYWAWTNSLAIPQMRSDKQVAIIVMIVLWVVVDLVLAVVRARTPLVFWHWFWVIQGGFAAALAWLLDTEMPAPAFVVAAWAAADLILLASRGVWAQRHHHAT